MSFYCDQRSQGRWNILASVVCESFAESNSVAKMLRRDTKGTGIQVRTKGCEIRALGAYITVFVVVKRELATQAVRTDEPS